MKRFLQILFWSVMFYGVLCGNKGTITVGVSQDGQTRYVLNDDDVDRVIHDAFNMVLQQWTKKLSDKSKNGNGDNGGEGQSSQTDNSADKIGKTLKLVEILVKYGIKDIEDAHNSRNDEQQNGDPSDVGAGIENKEKQLRKSPPLTSSSTIPPQTGTRQQGTPQQGTPQQGTPQQGTPQQGTPQQGTPQKGTSQKGTSQQGTSQQIVTPPVLPQGSQLPPDPEILQKHEKTKAFIKGLQDKLDGYRVYVGQRNSRQYLPKLAQEVAKEADTVKQGILLGHLSGEGTFVQQLEQIQQEAAELQAAAQ